ncbi:MAG: DUF3078 domain-containing protein [Bacteroidetes bacterium]|nr:DUF3078 domain-containing protein [Bacteroidota bacterium]
MKKIIFYLSTLLLISTLSNAQDTIKKDTTYWKKSGFFGLNVSQTALSNWQGGGQDNVAANAIINAEAVYKKAKVTWTNKFDGQYGIIKPGDVKLFRKNIDQLFALSKLNIDAFHKHWFYAAQLDYRTQFAPGYNYIGDSIAGMATSDINSPGYVQLAVGLDYKPAPYFSAFLAPIAGKVTRVNRQYLADAGAFGVEKAVIDANGLLVSHGKKTRTEIGGRLVLKFKKDIVKNVNLDSYLDLFSNYLHNPGNIDVVFNNLLTFKINKYFTANIISQTVYDDDIIIKHDWNKDGLYDNKNDINGPRLQMLTTVAIGFGYKF